MSMSKYHICCNKCLEDISTVSTNAGKLWMDLCAYQANYGDYLRVAQFSEKDMATLERMKFLVSTEEVRPNDVENEYLVFLRCRTLNESGQDFFCKGNHEDT